VLIDAVRQGETAAVVTDRVLRIDRAQALVA
jgi:hypothetical protein